MLNLNSNNGTSCAGLKPSNLGWKKGGDDVTVIMSAMFKMCYEHFHSTKILHSAYLSQLFWYKRCLFSVANVLQVCALKHVHMDDTVYCWYCISLIMLLTFWTQFHFADVRRSHMVKWNCGILVSNPTMKSFSIYSSSDNVLPIGKTLIR